MFAVADSRWVITGQPTTLVSLRRGWILASGVCAALELCSCAPLSGTAVRLFLGEPSMSLSGRSDLQRHVALRVHQTHDTQLLTNRKGGSR